MSQKLAFNTYLINFTLGKNESVVMGLHKSCFDNISSTIYSDSVTHDVPSHGSALLEVFL